MKKNLTCKLKLIRSEEGKILSTKGDEIGKMIVGEYFSPQMNKYLCAIEIYDKKTLIDNFFNLEYNFGTTGLLNPKQSPVFANKYRGGVEVFFPDKGKIFYK